MLLDLSLNPSWVNKGALTIRTLEHGRYRFRFRGWRWEHLNQQGERFPRNCLIQRKNRNVAYPVHRVLMWMSKKYMKVRGTTALLFSVPFQWQHLFYIPRIYPYQWWRHQSSHWSSDDVTTYTHTHPEILHAIKLRKTRNTLVSYQSIDSQLSISINSCWFQT